MKASKAGFTLVELIVVIAILAILAGVAVPVYSGYIAKANEAADLQLLGALNTAFAASCLEMGLDPTQVIGLATLSGEAGDKRVASVTAAGVGAANLSSREAFNDLFLRYFGDNVNTPFKVYTSLGYDTANGVFVDGAKEIRVSFGNGTITVTAADITAFQLSTFSSLGVETLTDTIDDLATHVVMTYTSSIAGDPESGRDPSPAFIAFLNTLDLGDRTIDDLTLEERANAIALWVASSSNDLNAAEIAGRMANGESPLEGGGTDGLMASYAMQYAMLMAYANSDYSKDYPYVVEDKTITGMGSLTQQMKDEYIRTYGEENVSFQTNGPRYTITIKGSSTSISDLFATASGNNLTTDSLASTYGKVASTEGFQSYMQGQGASDLSGYLATMKMINDNTQNIDVYQVLSNGFSDPDLNNMLIAILGN
ncbi:MAG: pilin [Oscillospiraceae bacterium]|nr:pilin [Oscillospiraceae bacterium]